MIKNGYEFGNNLLTLVGGKSGIEFGKILINNDNIASRLFKFFI